MFSFNMFALLGALMMGSATHAQLSGTAITTRYWDCCKESCSWAANVANVAGGNPVASCAKDGVTTLNDNTASGCNSGTAYTCNNNQPFVGANNISYGFVAANFAGLGMTQICCQCLKLTFTSAPISGKVMYVQVTNTGSDLNTNQFDIQMPGGGVGIFNGCQSQWGAPSSGWGAQYGGISSQSQCSQLPTQLQPGCNWRFGWFQNANNPNVNWQVVACPSQLTSITGCSPNSQVTG